jgi:hypothetical protein
MNTNRHLFSGMPSQLLKSDGHLSDDWLLLSIDGALSASDHSRVEEHVRACWTCRARMEQLEKTIREIVEYEHALAAPDMPPSPRGKVHLHGPAESIGWRVGQAVPDKALDRDAVANFALDTLLAGSLGNIGGAHRGCCPLSRIWPSRTSSFSERIASAGSRIKRKPGYRDQSVGSGPESHYQGG